MRLFLWTILVFFLLSFLFLQPVYLRVKDWSKIKQGIAQNCESFYPTSDDVDMQRANELKLKIEKNTYFRLFSTIRSDSRFYAMRVDDASNFSKVCWTGWVSYWGDPALVFYLDNTGKVNFYKVFDTTW